MNLTASYYMSERKVKLPPGATVVRAPWADMKGVIKTTGDGVVGKKRVENGQLMCMTLDIKHKEIITRYEDGTVFTSKLKD